ncbi:MAG: hypothetical protein KAT35_04570, partial [Candidatus Aenigmarchaeota archaeon]|nr:hypothetical protein [Candidatus Aenigmarchaeota archaeon]
MKNVPGKRTAVYLILSVGVLVTMGYAAAQSAQQGHPWTEIILPVGTTWVGLDADMLDGYHWSDVTALLLWGSSGTSIFNLNSGNVGIGTNSPTQELDVDGSLRVRGLTGCDTIDTDSSGNLARGTDDDGVGACSECDSSFVNEGQSNSISTSMISDGNVQAIDIATNAVTSSKIQDGSVANADLANNAVTSGKIQDGTVGSADINSGQVQERVSGTCAAGSSIRAISSAGGVTCEPDDSGGSGGDITGVTAGNGLTGGGSSGAVTLNVGSGTGISVGSNTVGLSYPSKSCPAGQSI